MVITATPQEGDQSFVVIPLTTIFVVKPAPGYGSDIHFDFSPNTPVHVRVKESPMEIRTRIERVSGQATAPSSPNSTSAVDPLAALHWLCFEVTIGSNPEIAAYGLWAPGTKARLFWSQVCGMVDRPNNQCLLLYQIGDDVLQLVVDDFSSAKADKMIAEWGTQGLEAIRQLRKDGYL